MKQRFRSILICMALCLFLLPMTAGATELSDVSYIERSWSHGQITETQPKKAAVSVTDKDTAWGTEGQESWYVVSGNVTIQQQHQSAPSPLTVSGTVNLILTDGCTLTVSSGIHVPKGNTLNIYGQTVGSGRLEASSGSYSSIMNGFDQNSCGTISIHGGTVETDGGIGSCSGAGIGGSGGIVTIYGGTITARGSEYSAGIGSGNSGDNSTVTIYGGTITAYGGIRGAGIGGGRGHNGGTINILGGTVKAHGGEGAAGIGGGTAQYITNADGNVMRLLGGDSGYITIKNAVVEACAGAGGAGIGGGSFQEINEPGSPDIDMPRGGSIDIYFSTVTAQGLAGGAGIGGGAYGTVPFIYIYNCQDVTASSLTDSSLISGGAGIGGGKGAEGCYISIFRSQVTAFGCMRGAGVGGGEGGAGGEIIIRGGSVDAQSSGGAGIGGGAGGAGGSINIYSGTVDANSGSGACIGGGAAESGGTGGSGGIINIFGGTIKLCDNASGVGIGGGAAESGGTGGSSGQITIYGGTITSYDYETGGGSIDIGGAAGSTPTQKDRIVILGGSVMVDNFGKFPTNDLSQRLYSVTISQLPQSSSTESISLLKGTAQYGYGIPDTVQDGTLVLWLPDGTYSGSVTINEMTYLLDNFTVKGKDIQIAPSIFYLERMWDSQTNTLREESKLCNTYTIVTPETTVWESGWYVVNENVTIDAHITLSGTVNLILMDDCTLTVTNGIAVDGMNDSDSSSTADVLNIYAQSSGNDAGQLEVSVPEDIYSAGIGGDGTHCGTINIHGGIIKAVGGNGAAGIGGGIEKDDGGTISIYGGIVHAQGSNGGAGIGGGANGVGGTINIHGGTVTANGSQEKDGIGNGSNATAEEGKDCTILITGGSVDADIKQSTPKNNSGEPLFRVELSLPYSEKIESLSLMKGTTKYPYGMPDTAAYGTLILWLPEGSYTGSLITFSDGVHRGYSLSFTVGKDTDTQTPISLIITPPFFDSQDYDLYAQPHEGEIYIYNPGSRSVSITGASLSGKNADSFILGDIAGSAISPDSSDTLCQVQTKAGLDAGTYTAILTVTYDSQGNSYSAAAELIFTINKAQPSLDIYPTPCSITYNGHLQQLITPGSVNSGGELLYSTTKNGTYSKTIPTGKDPGNYVVWFKLTETKNYFGQEPEAVYVTIEKDIPDELPQVFINYINETLSTTTAMEYQITPDTEWIPCSVDNMKAADFGWDGLSDIWVEFRTAQTDSSTESEILSVLIPKRPVISDVQGSDETISGLNDGTITGVKENMEFRRQASDNTWTPWTGCPDGSIPNLEPGTYEIRYPVITISGHEQFASLPFPVAIGRGEPKDFTLTVTPPAFADTVYGTQPAAGAFSITNNGNWPAAITNAALSGANSSSFKLNQTSGITIQPGKTDSSFTVQPISGLNAGTYTATLTVTYTSGAFGSIPAGTDAKEVQIDVKITVTRANSTLTTAPVAKANLVYNGQAQELVTAGTAAGGKLVYSTSKDGAYTETIPTGTDPGNYTVWYKVEENQNYNGADAVSIPVTIAKAANKVPPTVSIDYAAETLSTSPALEYSTDNGSSWVSCTDTMGISAFGWKDDTAVTVQFRTAETAFAQASTVQTLIIPSRPAAPTGLKIVSATGAEAKDGQILGVTPDMAYKITQDTIWYSVTGTTITGLAPNDYDVRYQAVTAPDKSAFAGQTVTVTVDFKASGGGGNTDTPPSGGTDTPPSGGGNTDTPPSGGGTDTPPSGGGTDTPPSGGGNTDTPPSGGGSTDTPPSGGGSTDTPGGDNSDDDDDEEDDDDDIDISVSGSKDDVQISGTTHANTAIIDSGSLSNLSSVLGTGRNNNTLSIDLSGLRKGVDTLELPTRILDRMVQLCNGTPYLDVTFPSGVSIELNVSALEKRLKNQNVSISVCNSDLSGLTRKQKDEITDRPFYDITITSDSRSISNPGDTITITAPYHLRSGENPEGIVVWYVDEDGNLERCKTTYDRTANQVSWETDHLSVYMIGYEEILLENPFTDVPDDADYLKAVLWAAQSGITWGSGADTFNPDAVCTRSQMVTFLWKAMGSPLPKSNVNPFLDLPTSTHYVNAVLWAYEQKIVGGTSDTTFSPNAPCTRAQMITLLWKASGAPAPRRSWNPFTDVPANAYYANALQWAYEQRIISGTIFRPDAPCTRADMATFLYHRFGR